LRSAIVPAWNQSWGAVSEGIFVSFVVIAYNEANNIGRAIATIVSLAGLDEYEIIVVNDGSRDGTGEVVAEFAERDPRIRLINLRRNRGRGQARNSGIAVARGDLIATIDADIVLPPDWLVRTRAALRGHHAVGGTAVPDGDVSYLFKRFRLVPRAVGHTTAVTGSNALYRRQVFGALGFDPALRDGEDVALNHAARDHGLSFATVPGLLVEHLEDKTLSCSLRWLFVSGKGATRQLLTYRQVRPPDMALGAFAAAMAAGLFAAQRGKRLAGAAIPAALVLAVSTQHVRSRFETPLTQWQRVGPAIAVDSVLLTAYFAGRLTGLAGMWRQLGRYRRPAWVSGERRDDGPAGAGRFQGILKERQPVTAADDPVMKGQRGECTGRRGRRPDHGAGVSEHVGRRVGPRSRQAQQVAIERYGYRDLHQAVPDERGTLPQQPPQPSGRRAAEGLPRD
jgi:hypothetical protein